MVKKALLKHYFMCSNGAQYRIHDIIKTKNPCKLMFTRIFVCPRRDSNSRPND